MHKLTAQINFLGSNLNLCTELQLHLLLAYLQLLMQQQLHSLQTQIYLQIGCSEGKENLLETNTYDLTGSAKKYKKVKYSSD